MQWSMIARETNLASAGMRHKNHGGRSMPCAGRGRHPPSQLDGHQHYEKLMCSTGGVQLRHRLLYAVESRSRTHALVGTTVPSPELPHEARHPLDAVSRARRFAGVFRAGTPQRRHRAAWTQAVLDIRPSSAAPPIHPRYKPRRPAPGRPRCGRWAGRSAPIAVVSAVAQTEDLPITLTSIGWIEPIATVTVRARTDGQVVEKHAQDGQMVNAGDLLFRLDDREIQAQIARDEAALARDNANQAKAEADLKRTEQLVSKNIASQVQVEQYSADAKVAAANVAADKAALEADRIRLDYATVRAPISGRPRRRSRDRRQPGPRQRQHRRRPRYHHADEAAAGVLLASGAQPRSPARGSRPQGGGSGSSLCERIDRILATGALTFVDSAVDQTSGTINAKATFPNEDGRLWPGQYVRVSLDVGKRPNATTVPLVAIAPGQDSTFAYVVTPGKGDRAAQGRGHGPARRCRGRRLRASNPASTSWWRGSRACATAAASTRRRQDGRIRGAPASRRRETRRDARARRSS